ncbi:alpha/beta fold hydrolase [Aestuariibius sp. 2305UL40-4]|uniref:alpha/beta fold hydrolase n=1 Tax=Aestuariibius violaceus TaxID=3234132 RepID=UPI00345EAB21
MIDGFTETRIDTGDVTLSVHRAGQGHPLILLHGYPQNHHCWARVAPAFAEHFDTIIPDLRGYGASDAPPDDPDHTVYFKRRMAEDIIGLMDTLNLDRAHILGHDRGARVTYRLALDHPRRIAHMGIIEIVPTGDFWAAWNADLAMAAYHWTFLAQPHPLPETLIAADPEGYIDHTLKSWTLAKDLSAFRPEALASYRAQAADPARLHAMCADYRAGATTDRRIDEAETAQIAAPTMFLYAEAGFPARSGDPAALWSRWCADLQTASCRSGHFAMEENPEAVTRTFLPFFRAR